jgi:hypothetical protein
MRAAALYDEDFYAWALAQAQALRELSAARWNGPLDLDHLAEEVEDLGKAERRAVLSQTKRLIEHLLKLEFARERDSRHGWIVSCDDARSELDDHLTATLRRELEAALPDLYRRERKRTAKKLKLMGEPEAADALPAECPYTIEQLLDEDWLPASRHGWVDGV